MHPHQTKVNENGDISDSVPTELYKNWGHPEVVLSKQYTRSTQLYCPEDHNEYDPHLRAV